MNYFKAYNLNIPRDTLVPGISIGNAQKVNENVQSFSTPVVVCEITLLAFPPLIVSYTKYCFRMNGLGPVM